MSEPPQDSAISQPHEHFYRYTPSGEFALRYCECGKSWVLVELRSLVDHSTIYMWRETKEEDEI